MKDEALGYFAYGANMASRVFIDRRGMRPSQMRVARLVDYALTFDHAGLPVFDEAFANLEPSGGSEVWGILYELDPESLELLDRLEGGGAYEHHRVTLVLEDGSEVEAVAYMSDIRAHGLRPSRRYRDLLVEGAEEHALPERWLAILRGIPCSAAWVPERLAGKVPVIAERLFRLGVPLRQVSGIYWWFRRCLSRPPPSSSKPTTAAAAVAARNGQDGRRS